MAGDEGTSSLKTIKESITPLVADAVSFTKDQVGKALPFLNYVGDSSFQKYKQARSYLKSVGDYSGEKYKQAQPVFKEFVNYTLEKYKQAQPFLKNVGDYSFEKYKQAQPFLKEYGDYCLEKTNQALVCMKEVGDYCYEKIKQHPYLFGSLVVIFILLKFGLFPPLPKMMKAPGRPGFKIPRARFVADPRSYFFNLRAGKSL